MRFFFVLLVLAIFSHSSKAAVWEDNQVWSLQYEEEFSQWMQSAAVNETMFTSPQSPYYGINTDCADTAYALRAIFAYEHLLPFAIRSPSGSRGRNRTLNNRLTNWDAQRPTSIQRLIAMINEIGESVGTESLAHFDTFPVALKSIQPGSLFMYKIKARFGNFIRHNYNIKSISDIGTFDVIYSTQANKAKKLPLIRRKNYDFDKLPSSPWGFKKFRWPEHINQEISTIPMELGPSIEQYALAERLGANAFFKLVRKTLSVTNETSAQRLNRSFQAVCLEAQSRIGYVNQGLERLKETNNRCMNYADFDAYSTPARDQGLHDLFLKLQSSYTELLAEDNGRSANPQLLQFASLIVNKKNPTNPELLLACPINYREGVSLDLSNLWIRISKGLLSSHPNDIIELRWGEKSSPATRCKRWY